ncbi:P-loop NTPase fold protein [Dysgonomonas sp. ZJ709]|uniref:KAP family P-loop NTPase fold protein n=1 Tax=Dysgonomonas sp. ZJ709 TaxID=2709797 RepID=UPI0013ECC66B|nr:P-loop NTPase fold protein [Dysgonomonas sp. ZJ709]
MRIKHSDIIIDKDNPFANCELDREPCAKILTDIVNSYKDGFVLAINNEWGTGKTTFVKMWQQYLDNNDYNTLYFNAWENDFDSNPLVAIMSELKTLTNPSNDKFFKSVLQKGAMLSKNILPALLKAIAQKYIETDTIINAIENTTKGVTEILEEEIKEYTNKKQSVKEFRDELEKFVAKTDSDKPIVFIIDELDRCRPNYAVEVLEQMKHFFSVKGIVFVLSIDKIQLGHAIKGVYGNENINSEEYLRRFIDLEYSIPIPSIDNFCKYLYEYYSFDDFFASKERSQHSIFQPDRDYLLKMATILLSKANATLRQQEKIFGQTRLIINAFAANNYAFPHLLFVLVYIKIMKPNLYLRIEKNTISLQDLSDEFSNLVPKDLSPYGLNMLYVEAVLLTFYNNQQDHSIRKGLTQKNEEGETVSIVKSKLEVDTDRNSLVLCLDSVSREWNYGEKKLSYLLNKINLIEPLKV